MISKLVIIALCFSYVLSAPAEDVVDEMKTNGTIEEVVEDVIEDKNPIEISKNETDLSPQVHVHVHAITNSNGRILDAPDDPHADFDPGMMDDYSLDDSLTMRQYPGRFNNQYQQQFGSSGRPGMGGMGSMGGYGQQSSFGQNGMQQGMYNRPRPPPGQFGGMNGGYSNGMSNMQSTTSMNHGGMGGPPGMMGQGMGGRYQPPHMNGGMSGQSSMSSMQNGMNGGRPFGMQSQMGPNGHPGMNSGMGGMGGSSMNSMSSQNAMMNGHHELDGHDHSSMGMHGMDGGMGMNSGMGGMNGYQNRESRVQHTVQHSVSM